MPQFNPLDSFQAGQAGTLALDKTRQSIARETAAAPVRNQLAQLGLEQAQTANTQAQAKSGQDEGLRTMTLLNQAAKALKATDQSQWQQALPRIQQFLNQQNVDTSSLDFNNLNPQALDSFIAESDQLIRDPSKLAQLTGGERERQSLMDAIAPALDADGRIDPAKLNATSRAAAIKLRLLPGAVGSGAITTATQGLTGQVASSKGDIAEAVEGAKLGKQLEFKPLIQKKVKEAEALGKARGDSNIQLVKAEAAIDGITEVVGELRLLADDATFTLSGKAFNEVSKQFGYSTSGGTARASMISLIDNQVLPLLRPIFGAAFTKAEGDSLKKSLADPDSTGESRKAQLDAFLNQMNRNIESMRAEGAALDGGLGEKEADDYINSILGR